MLDVYTHPIPRPQGSLDLSLTPLDELADTVLDICAHQKDIVIWFGYLDGWMLTPRDEVLLRKALRKFTCIVVSCFPVAFSLAWQNEIRAVITSEGNGFPHTDHNGRSVHNEREAGYGHSGP
jgi:hypothetical protein